VARRKDYRFAAVHESLPGTFETSHDVRSLVAVGGKPDIAKVVQ
jgi:hypothetical protein